MKHLEESDESLRSKMVEEQLEKRGINDNSLLAAFRKVPRHEFVEILQKKYAYTDSPILLEKGQTISQPYMVALMTQALSLNKDCKVLEIGTGSGYQTAILAELALKVFSVEYIESLLEKAKSVLNRLNYSNIEFALGDGSLGWKEVAPFDRIVVTCGAPSMPEPLLEQLANSGKMVIPVGSRFSQDLMLVEKNNLGIAEKSICGCMFVPLVGKYGWGAK